jgi:hypothetical protein
MPTIGDILLEFSSIIIVFLLTVAGFIFFAFSKQRKLRRFFGIKKESQDIDVYLSSLFIPQYTSTGFDGRPRSYQGPAIPIGELGIIASLASALKLSGFDNIPAFIRDMLAKVNKNFQPLNINPKASPLKETEINFRSGSTIITVGSQGYNIVTNYCVDNNLSQMQIVENGTAIQIMKGKRQGEIVRPVSDKHDIAILEKLTERTRDNTTIFIAAGLGVLGTMGTIQYLVDKWEKLASEYPDDFAFILQFGPIDRFSFEECLHEGERIRQIPDSI